MFIQPSRILLAAVDESNAILSLLKRTIPDQRKVIRALLPRSVDFQKFVVNLDEEMSQDNTVTVG